MRIQSVIDQALNDEKFGLQLRDQAMQAARAGVGSEAWGTLAAHFASSPEELAHLKKLGRAGSSAEEDKAITTTMATTLVTLTHTSAACTMTTTTTTTTTFTGG